MSTDPLQHPAPEKAELAREGRLLEIRREAEKKGRVEGSRRPSGGCSVSDGLAGNRLLRRSSA